MPIEMLTFRGNLSSAPYLLNSLTAYARQSTQVHAAFCIPYNLADLAVDNVRECVCVTHGSCYHVKLIQCYCRMGQLNKVTAASIQGCFDIHYVTEALAAVRTRQSCMQAAYLSAVLNISPKLSKNSIQHPTGVLNISSELNRCKIILNQLIPSALEQHRQAASDEGLLASSIRSHMHHQIAVSSVFCKQ